MSDRAKIYAILYDRDNVDTEALHNFISHSEMVKNWWHYIKSCYIIKSSCSVSDITDALPASIREGGFLVVEINLDNSNGWLTDKAWRWISRRQEEERV